MDFLQIIMITLHFTHVITKSRNKKYESSSSDETIENLLYFKDCQRKPKQHSTTPVPLPLRLPSPPPPQPPPSQSECRFPKMCCALSCGNECGGNKDSSFISRQMEPVPNIPRQSIQPMIQSRQPSIMPVQPQLRKRKKIKFPSSNKMQLPISSRRDFGFTKEKIKSLISQDNDIRKILKDLVRVTMEKVDLMDMLNGSRRSGDAGIGDGVQSTNINNPTTPEAVFDYDYDE